MKTAACQFLAVMFVAPCALIGLIQAQTVSDGDSVCPVSVELRTPNTFGREESGKTIFIEIRAAERRTETFLPQLNSLESLLLSRGMRIDRVWAGVKHLYLRINASGVSDAARGDIVAELKAQPLVGKLFSSATANYELRDLGQLEPALSISGLSEAKLRGFREKRRDFKPDLTGRDTGEIIVKYIEAETAPLGRRAVARARMGLLHAAVGARVVQSLDLSTGFADVVALPEGVDTRAVLERYLSDESVEYAEPNHVYAAFATPNDTYYNYQWGMSKISAPDAWDVRTSASSVVVAVTDTGIDYNHNDIYGNLWQSGGYCGYNFIYDNNYPMDDNVLYEYVWNPNTWEWERVPYDEVYHGTHVAGIIGAVGNNEAGISGVAWNIKLMAVKVLDSVGGIDAATLADGIDYARTHGAQVVNASWGGSSYDQIVHDAVEALNDAGVVLVCAAGNDGLENDGSAVYPANFGFPSTIVVGATDSFDVRSNWGAKATNYGRWSVDLFAPGTSIYSTLGGSRYRYMNGTSMAAPHVSGIIALAKAQFSAESATELVDRARWSSDSVSGLAAYCQSGGRANAAAALGPRPRLINLSSRCQVKTGDQIAISGIVITEPDSKRVAFRALGPSLPLSGALANPQLTVYNSNGTAIGSNDDWSSLSAADRNELISFGIAPSSSLESAWIGSLSPGAYSVHMSGAGGTTGVGLIESWDIDGSTANRMVNISTRCYVGTGDQVAIAGFAIAGTKPRQVYIRALGPTLTSYGVSGPLADTVIELHDSGGVIESNDDWRSFDGTSTALETRLTNTGYPPTDNRESVIVRRLAPGNYTVILAGKSGATGVGLIEVNEY